MTALVTLTLTSVAYTITRTPAFFTNARCPECRRMLMAIPGSPRIECRTVASNAHRSGRGRVLSCNRCTALVEIIEHVG